MTTLAHSLDAVPRPDAAAVAWREPVRLPGLDVLRGLAILLVLPHNLVLPTQPTGLVSSVVLAWLERGWIGVHLFFALSGFLITGVLMDTARSRNGLPVFFARRALRIFPLYYAALLLGLALLPALHWPGEGARDGAVLWASYWVYLSNWVTAPPGGGATFPHFWSLAVEEQFYVIWPLLVYRLEPRRVVAAGLLLAALSLLARCAMLAQGMPEEFIYKSTLGRMGTLVLGGAMAAALREPTLAPWLARHRGRLPWVAGGAVVVAAVAGRLHSYGPWAQTLGYDALSLACVGVVAWVALRGPAVVVTAAHPARPGVRQRAARALQRMFESAGRYSYGLYVLHVPVATFVGYPLLRHLGYRIRADEAGTLLTGCPLAAYVLAAIAFSVVAAMASYHGLEKHCLRRKPAYRP